jgi:hypothetical protein
MPRARTEEVAPSRYQYEKIRLPPEILSERDVACNQIPTIINEKLRQFSFGFSESQRQARKYPARLFSTPVLPHWITWIVAKQSFTAVLVHNLLSIGCRFSLKKGNSNPVTFEYCDLITGATEHCAKQLFCVRQNKSQGKTAAGSW